MISRIILGLKDTVVKFILGLKDTVVKFILGLKDTVVKFILGLKDTVVKFKKSLEITSTVSLSIVFWFIRACDLGPFILLKKLRLNQNTIILSLSHMFNWILIEMSNQINLF